MRYHTPYRRGSMLLDAAMATAVLSVAMIVTLQVLDRIASQRRAADRRQFAIHWVANALEQLSLQSWKQLAPGPLDVPPLDANTLAVLPGAQASATSADDAGAGTTRRITVEVCWTDRAGGASRSVRLVTWVARAGRCRP